MTVLKLWIWSDLHLERPTWEFPAQLPCADVAVVPGDVKRLPDAVDWLADRLDNGTFKVRRVVFVPGNHEYHHREMTEALDFSRRRARDRGIDLLDMDEVVIDGVRFLGGTLWTDFALDGDYRKGMVNCTVGMDDSKCIGLLDAGRVRALRSEDTRRMHQAYVEWLERKLSTPYPGPTVVVTHHAPSRGSLHARYEGDPLNPGFASDLRQLIERYQPTVWVHGHCHDNFRYPIGGTQVICNPKGVDRDGRDENPSFDPLFTLELETGSVS